MPGSADVVLYLVLLPLVILFLLWFARKLVLLASAAPLAAAAPAAGAQEAPAPAAAPPLHLVAGALRLPHGASPDAVRAAIAANEARPALDPALLDDHGFPVMSARIPGLDPAAAKQALAAWLASQNLPDPGFNDEQWRALALGADIVTELAAATTAHPALASRTDTALPVTLPPTLQLLPLLPADWNLAQRLAAGRWMLSLVHRHGWPVDHLALSAAAERGTSEPLALLTHMAAQATTAAQPCLVMMVACASHLGDDTLDAWSRQGVLFTARNQRGQIPGEGAAGLLVADAAQAALLAHALQQEPAPHLHGAVHGAHGSSADGPGQRDASLLSKLGQDALQGAASATDDVQLIVGDADHRGSRTAELMSAASAAAPHLDAATHVIGVAACCGHAGAVGALAALVLARQEVADHASHVVYFSNQDPYQRSAAVVRPPPAPVPQAAPV